jgi:hypothetical protein
MLRAKGELESYQELKRSETVRLAQGIASGPHVVDVFRRLKGSPVEVKGVFYGEAIRLCHGDKLLSIFILLASEDVNLTRSLLGSIPPSPISRSFFQYLRSRGSEWAKFDDFQELLATSENGPGLDALFDLIGLPVGELLERAKNESPPDLTESFRHAERIFPTLPEAGYGGFVRQKLILLASIAFPESPIADHVVSLVSTATDSQELIELLQYVSPARLVQISLNLMANSNQMQDSLTACVLDALRSRHDNFLSQVSSETLRLGKSRNPALSLSARAAAFRLGLIEEETFARSLARAVASDRKKTAVQWLARNPEFLDVLPTNKLSGRIFAEILEALLATEPSQAIRYLRDILSANQQILDRRSWSAAVKVLGGVDNRFADEIFVDLVVRSLQGGTQRPEDDLSRDPALTLLYKNIWAVALRSYETRSWNIIFDAIAPRLTSASLLTWLQGAPPGRNELQTWIRSEYIPRLFEHGILSSHFLVTLPHAELKREFMLAICEAAARRFANINAISQEWASKVSARKKSFADKVSIGLRIASGSAKLNQSLQARLEAMGQDIREWVAAESLRLDPELSSILEITLPKPQNESVETLQKFFSQNPNSPHEIAFFFASNPWAIRTFLTQEKHPWPKFDIVAEQIVKSLNYFSRLNDRATTTMQHLDENLKIDLAIALRDNIDEFEEMIAGYFALRNLLAEIGLERAEPELGVAVDTAKLSSEKHKVIRDPSQKGQLRVFSLGFKVNDKVVANSRIMESGEQDDSD